MRLQEPSTGRMTEHLITLRDLMIKHLVSNEMSGQEGTAYLAQHNIFDQIPALRPLVRLSLDQSNKYASNFDSHIDDVD
eukprot:SAG31_NODE_5507_length_2494_cov_1.124008_2_plen_79_part_00